MEIPGKQREPGSCLQRQDDKPVQSPCKGLEGTLESALGKEAPFCLFYMSISPLGPFLTDSSPAFFFAIRPPQASAH